MVQAAKLDKMEQAYEFYLRTSRLDLDDYNHEVDEGLHITSMAGTWLSIVEGFGGMRIKNNTLSLTPKIPKQWKEYSFKINFRNRILKITISKNKTSIIIEKGEDLEVIIDNKKTQIQKNNLVTV